MEETLLDAYRTALLRYAYFLLVAAAAGILLAVYETEFSVLKPSLAPLGLAVLCWAASFYYGCIQIEAHFTALRVNAVLLKARNGHRHPGTDAAVALDTAETAFRRATNRMVVNGRRQFIFLVQGAILYMIWHVLEMFLRTVGAA